MEPARATPPLEMRLGHSPQGCSAAISKLVIPNPVAHWHAVSGLQRIGANGGEGSAFRFLATRHSPPLFPSAVDLAHGPSDCACVLHRRPYLRACVNRHSRNARLL